MDEEDFMSDAFLTGLGQATVPEVLTYSQRRERDRRLQEERNRAAQMQPKREVEQQQREQGLARPLSDANRGFQLFQKLASRKHQRADDAIEHQVEEQSVKEQVKEVTEDMKEVKELMKREPLSLDLKLDRKGLGHSERKRVKCDVEVEEKEIETELDPRLFQERMRRRFELRRIHGDLIKSRVACESLDKQAGRSRNPFWMPEPEIKRNEESLGEVDGLRYDPEQNIVWEVDSGAEEEQKHKEAPQDDANALEGESFGETSPEHCSQKDPMYSTTEHQLEDTFQDLPEEEQLLHVTAYLRNQHFYCHWCGIQYDGKEQLEEECPGDSAEAH